jgi:lipopolysaccharide transport system ATP-binding protein
MSSNDFAIRVSNLSKAYEIYKQPQDRLKQSIQPRLQRLMGLQPKRYFDEFWALHDVSFEVNKGETVGIIGRNGSGKSTLLQLICGTLTPTSGSVQTNGRIAALLELGSGFNPDFTGRENVYLNATVLGLSKQEIDDRFEKISAFADIGQFIEQPVKTYSSGMVVRLAFSIAINVDTQILIVDEALSVGDERFQRKCFSRIEEIKNNGATILFVSHSGNAIIELCDRAILLDAGENLAIGIPKQIVGKYQKLIYAPDDKRNQIREEIQAFSSHGQTQNPPSNMLQVITQEPGEHKRSVDNETEDFFDPNLKPVSTLFYEPHGVYIEPPEILSMAGEKVNCINRGKTYRYTYKVRFEHSATNVRFGMMIKTVTGFELGGGVSAPDIGQSISFVSSGTVAIVEFWFTCYLNPGLYYLNAGVTGAHQQEETYLHRIMDACMFRVMPITDNIATAIVNFNCSVEFNLLNNPLE